MSRDQLTRRDLLASGLAATATLTMTSATTGRPVVRGIVFHDRSASGSRSAGGPGLPGIMVSNGIDIAVSDSTGAWELPFRPGEFVFPIKPTDWSPGRRANGLPHLGERLGDNAPPTLIEFGLRHAVEPRQFSVALVADTQPANMTELGYLRDTTLSAVAQSDVDFAINHGDIVFDNPSLHRRYVDLIRATDVPWYHCPGNHDMDRRENGTTDFDTWKSVFGPTHYAFQYGGVTFIALNNVDPLASDQPTRSGHDYRGRIGPDQIAFVQRLLRFTPKEQPIVVSMHIPLIGWEDPSDPSGHTSDAVELLRLLSGRPMTLSLAGHTHTTEHHHLGSEHGFSGPGTHHHHVLTAACGSWWSGPFDHAGNPLAMSRDGTPKGFHILDVSAAGLTTRFVPVGHAGHPKLSVWLEGNEAGPGPTSDAAPAMILRSPAIVIGELACTRLSVNVFDGGPRTVVNCKVQAHTIERELPLARTDGIDACTASTYCQHRPAIKSWVEAARCSHLWSAALPHDLPAGTYAAIITVKDEYGRASGGSLIFEVIA